MLIKLRMGEVGTYSVSSESRAEITREARRGEFTDGMGYQKCPSMFFILYRYIEHVYIYYLHIYSKIVINILMGFKI